VPVPRPPFVGRADELARLLQAVQDVRAGAGRLVVVRGPAGAGKSALLNALVARADAVPVLRATGVQGEHELPFAALDALVRPLLDLRRQLPEAQRIALEQALALAGGEPPTRYAVAAATLSLLAAGAEQQPLLCVIDDLQWIDGPSCDCLLFAARRLSHEGIAMVVAARDDDERTAALANPLQLAPLAPDAARELLGALTGGALPAELADQLVEAAQGSPLALRELVARLDRSHLEGREALVGPLPPAAGAAELIGARLAGLPDATQRALLVLGAADDADTPTLTRALRELGLTLDDLAPAEAAELVTIRPDRVQAGHPLVRSVAYHARRPDERRQAHRAVATALDPRDRRRPWQLAAAADRPDERVAAQLDAGANDAHRRGGAGSAARTRRRAAELTPDPRRRAERQLAAAEDFFAAGLGDEARAVAAEALAAEPGEPLGARLRALLARTELARGRTRAARDRLLAEVEALPPGDAAHAIQDATYASLLLGDLDAVDAHSERALALAPDDDHRRAAIALRAAALVAVGRPTRAAAMLRGEDTNGDADTFARDVRTGAVHMHVLLAHARLWLGDWDDAEALLGRLVAHARATSALAILPYVVGLEATLDLRRGRWPAAWAKASEAVTLAETVGDGGYLTGSLTIRAGIAAVTGRSRETVADAERALALARDSAPRLRVFAHHALGLLALGQRRVHDAVEQLETAAEAAAADMLAEPGAMVWEPDRIEALVRDGQAARAERALQAWEGLGERYGRIFTAATAARCRGLLVADEELDAQFTHALALHDDLGLPFERARTQLVYGERLRRARRRADARGPLREALDAFERLGAPDWAQRARVELRATGGAVPPVARELQAELTPHELQVALMAAEGRTNREIAGALFLAPKTIEHHLSAIFRKLDIRRRTELAAALASSEASPRPRSPA